METTRPFFFAYRVDNRLKLSDNYSMEKELRKESKMVPILVRGGRITEAHTTVLDMLLKGSDIECYPMRGHIDDSKVTFGVLEDLGLVEKCSEMVSYPYMAEWYEVTGDINVKVIGWESQGTVGKGGELCRVEFDPT